MSTDATDTPDTRLETLAAIIGRPDAVAVMEHLVNGNGGKYVTRTGDVKRASRAELSYRGVPLVVEYTTTGYGDDAYIERVRSIEIGHVESLALFEGEQLAEIIERVEKQWGEV